MAMYSSKRSLGSALLILVLVVAIAACGDATEDTAAEAPEEAVEEQAEEVETQEPEPEEAEETATEDPATGESDETLMPEGDLSFKIGTSSTVDPVNLAGAMTAGRLNEAGWDVEVVEHAQTHLNTQGLAQGLIQWSATRHVEPLRLIQEGEESIRYMFENSGLDYGIVIASDMACEDMDGLRFAIHGEAATASLMAVNYLRDDCGADIDVLVIPGGENRVIALEAGEIEGTSVAFEDFLELEERAPGEFQLLDTGQYFAVAGMGWWANADWVEENREVAVAWVAEVLKTWRMMRDDPSMYLEAAQEWMPHHEDTTTLEEIFDLYIENEGWPVNGGDAEAMKGAIDIFAGFGELDPGLADSIDNYINTEILEAALDEIGRVEGER